MTIPKPPQDDPVDLAAFTTDLSDPATSEIDPVDPAAFTTDLTDPDTI